MKYDDLCLRLRMECGNSGKFLHGQADTADIDIRIRDMDDEHAHSFVYINKVQMKFRRLQLGMQKPCEDSYLLISGFFDEKSIKISDIEEIYFNHRGWETIHG